MTPKRLQVVLDAKELAEIQRHARQQRMTTAEWVRQANQMDEIWVPSTFNAETFRASGVKRPIHVIPLGIDRICEIDDQIRSTEQQPDPRTPRQPSCHED